VSSRTYLSIGDVLTLLREEFPDVTISKIRFLESQGLVNPERSPSGYRKFFDHDVERLRWVLRQQREHFLPLKVIRDRLDAGDIDLDDDGAGDSVANGKPAEPAEPGEPAIEPATATTTADDEAMARIVADATRRAALLPDAAPPGRDEPFEAGAPVVPDDRVAAHPASESRRQHERASAAASARSDDAARGRPRDRSATTPATPAPPARGGAGGASDGGATPATATTPTTPAATTAPAATGGATTPGRGGGAPPAGPPAERAVPRLPTSVVTGASLTTEELCSASGLSADELAGLESYGLIEATIVAGLRTYDEDALTLANLAASFRAFGIEPRHLRLYRNAADREMGLIEQVVIPLLRQRNPESRQRAGDAAEQLATLGQSMRASLLRVALRRHLGG
jgi:DNA-binding transcriptional MerR regulator